MASYPSDAAMAAQMAAAPSRRATRGSTGTRARTPTYGAKKTYKKSNSRSRPRKKSLGGAGGGRAITAKEAKANAARLRRRRELLEQGMPVRKWRRVKRLPSAKTGFKCWVWVPEEDVLPGDVVDESTILKNAGASNSQGGDEQENCSGESMAVETGDDNQQGSLTEGGALNSDGIGGKGIRTVMQESSSMSENVPTSQTSQSEIGASVSKPPPTGSSSGEVQGETASFISPESFQTHDSLMKDAVSQMMRQREEG